MHSCLIIWGISLNTYEPSLLVMSCYLTNHSKISGLKQHKHLLCNFLWSTIWELLNWDFGSGSLEIAFKKSTGAAVSLKAWVGLEWLSPRRAHLHMAVGRRLHFFWMYLFILGCAESSLLNRLFSSYGKRTLWSCKDFSLQWLLLLRSTGSRATGSIVVLHGRNCFTACGIILDQGANLCLLHWQDNSLPLSY